MQVVYRPLYFWIINATFALLGLCARFKGMNVFIGFFGLAVAAGCLLSLRRPLMENESEIYKISGIIIFIAPILFWSPIFILIIDASLQFNKWIFYPASVVIVVGLVGLIIAASALGKIVPLNEPADQ